MPTISVLMGVYYRRESLELLRRSVASIRAQSFGDFELLICDDGSSPEAAALLDELAAEDPRLRLLRPGGCFSLPQKLNVCLAASRGAYIARMDDDDYSHPERFARQLAALEAEPGIDYVGCSVNLVCEGRPAGLRRFPRYPTARDFRFVQPFIHPALLFRREALLDVGGYSEDPRCLLCEDYDLLMRLIAAGHMGMNLEEPLLDYTIPATAHGSRTMRHRLNETVTRWRRFRDCGMLPAALPYVVKPLAVGLVPEGLLKKLKAKREKTI